MTIINYYYILNSIKLFYILNYIYKGPNSLVDVDIN